MEQHPMVPEPTQDGELPPFWRVPQRVQVALALVTGLALVGLLLVVMRPKLPGQAGTTTAIQRPVMTYRYTSLSYTIDQATPTIVGGPKAYPGSTLSATFIPQADRPLPSGAKPTEIVLETLLFGPFASGQALVQFQQALSQQEVRVPTPDASGHFSPEPWPQLPALGVQLPVTNVSGSAVTLRLTVPTTMPAGQYYYVMRAAWLLGGGEGGATISVLPARVTPTSTP